eukprot:1126137-Pleurochrysis_carterae.AAC.1
MIINIRYQLRSVGGAARARGLSAPARRLRCGGAARRGRPCARGDNEAWRAERERSTSTHAMQMQMQMGNCAFER